jgi:nitrogen regulation protein NR(I)
MMKDNPRVLIIEDDAGIASSLKHVLESEGATVETTADATDGLARARDAKVEVVLTDLQLPGPNGLQIIKELHRARPRLPVILMTGHHTTDAAIEAIKLGAFDYLIKPFDMAEMVGLIEKAVRNVRMASQPVDLGEGAAGHEAIVGRGRGMQAVYKEIGRVAARPVTVLVRGETGTGKELVARALHQHSDRAAQPFIVVNCVAIPDTLLESELFGHEPGAFTGAVARRVGRFEQADHGTILLDEVGDMSVGTQAKLLRVLQEKTIRRLGGRETIPVDVRIIAATHRDLEQAIRDGEFREDLYYRLNVVVIHLPPLRERREDIALLVRYFLERHGAELGSPRPSISPEALEFLERQPWPGNVRQLENIVRKSLLAASGFMIGLDSVRQALARSTPPHLGPGQVLGEYVRQLLTAAMHGEIENAHAAFTWDVERELYAQAIQLAGGNQARAAKWLGVSRPTLREKLKQYGLRAANNEAT